jgi:hypothetical protein
MYSEEAAKLLKTSMDFLVDNAIDDTNSSILRQRKIGMMLLREVLLNTEGVEQNANVSGKIISALNIIIKILKEASNELRILSIKILEKIVQIKALNEQQFTSICDALIETSDKS